MITELRKEIFWDLNYDSLDMIKNKRIIIDRVLNFGNISEFKHILSFYGKSVIRNEVKKVGYFDPKTLQFVLSFFNLKKEDLLCYTRKRSSRAHWN